MSVVGERKERPYINLSAQTLLNRVQARLDALEDHTGIDRQAVLGDLHELLDETGRAVRRLKDEIRELSRSEERLSAYHAAAVSRVEELEAALWALWGDGSKLMPPWRMLCDSFDQTRDHVGTARWVLNDLADLVGTDVMSQTLLERLEEELQKAWEGLPRQEDVFIRRDPEYAGEGECFIIELHQVLSVGPTDGDAFEARPQSQTCYTLENLSKSMEAEL